MSSLHVDHHETSGWTVDEICFDPIEIRPNRIQLNSTALQRSCIHIERMWWKKLIILRQTFQKQHVYDEMELLITIASWFSR